MVTLGFIEKVKIKDQVLNIEVVNRVPTDFSFLEEVEEYKVYEKQEKIDSDVHHYYLACRR